MLLRYYPGTLIAAAPPVTQQLAAPVVSTITDTGTQIYLDWNDAVVLASYTVEYSINQVNWFLAGGSSESEFYSPRPGSGTLYFRVRANSQTAYYTDSEWSATVSITI